MPSQRWGTFGVLWGSADDEQKKNHQPKMSVLLLKLFCFCFAALFFEGVISDGAFVWQGFDFAWLRREVGFQTPHRFGTFSSRFDNLSFTSSAHATAEYHAAFTPGVNGDFSHPKTFFRVIGSPQRSVSLLSKSIVFSTVDLLNKTTNTAIVQKQQPFSFRPVANQAAGLINGLKISMKCITGPGKICNSQSGIFLRILC